MPAHADDFRPTTTTAALAARAKLLRELRDFFHGRGFIEVETPLLASEVIPELHIEPIQISRLGFLQASPELHMKRLLASGADAIFQVTRSFRDDERGQLHNREFTIVEWYRRGDDMQAGIDFLDDLMQSLLGTSPATRTTYAATFENTLGVSPHLASVEQLAKAAESAKIPLPVGMKEHDRDEWLNLLLAAVVEPQLGRNRPEIIYHYPATQASLAKVITSPLGYEVAERFELYYRGIELANGFHELADAAVLRRRFEEVNAVRAAEGRPTLPMPKRLLAALEHGLPDCTGVALGFDRLAMLALGAKSIEEVICFPADRA
jgi:elongation factor P--(R)-beta-lysine ligase